MEIKVAEHAGTCFGVSNAIKIAFEAAKREKRIFILGQLVHNPFVVSQLQSKGVSIVDDLSELREGDSLIIRAHGEPKEVYVQCKKDGINIIDCTCPFVRRTQFLASELEIKGYQVLLVGDPDHPEVRGIAAQTQKPIIVSSPKDIISKIKNHEKVGILSQTTQKMQNFKDIVSNILDFQKELKIHNTICNATSTRQAAALRLCDMVETMVVIGGKNSANTKRLHEICSEKTTSFWITDASELRKEWFDNVKKVGITAGASTPKTVIDGVVSELERL
jgi:4-hydroxy-3-methylbut-2-enyl diphosphate reductase